MNRETLEVLEGLSWDPPPEGAIVDTRLYELRKKPLGELTLDEARDLIREQVGLIHLIPPLLDQLEKDLMVSCGLYPGDVLSAVAGVCPQFWLDHPGLARRWQVLADRPEGRRAVSNHPPFYRVYGARVSLQRWRDELSPKAQAQSKFIQNGVNKLMALRNRKK